jgi:hypothetical protein
MFVEMVLKKKTRNVMIEDGMVLIKTVINTVKNLINVETR